MVFPPEQVTVDNDLAVQAFTCLAALADIVDGLINEDACPGQVVHHILQFKVFRIQSGSKGLAFDKAFQLGKSGYRRVATFTEFIQLDTQLAFQGILNIVGFLEQGLRTTGIATQLIFRTVTIE